jgi:hypothetical protein
MKTNLLVAIANFVEDPITQVGNFYKSTNRINNVGDALEYYIKDLFCNSVRQSLEEKEQCYPEYFSYLGNQNNPPDIILKGGDAIEVKKISNYKGEIPLNSSYPKNRLFINSPGLSKACKTCENWQEKDLIYAIGTIPAKNNELKALWFVYGDCYAASKDCYERIRKTIAKGVNNLPDVAFSATKELGRVNKVDPLGITYLRIRGMWGIKHPSEVFASMLPLDETSNFTLNAIMLVEKYDSFPQEHRNKVESLYERGLTVRNIKIKSPDNPAKLLNAKLLKFEK